jgi:K+-sensing histidine kinase KdpD
LFYLLFKIRTQQYHLKQRRLERQVAEKTRELQQQNEVLEKNNTIKTRLISIISHDIITPLKFVTVAGKQLLERKENMTEALQYEAIQEITNTSQELQLLSTNILNWIKYQNENRLLVKEPFAVTEVVNQVFSILYSLARQNQVSLVNKVDEDLKLYQYFEPMKILVYNLVTNAIRFSDAGSISIYSTKQNGEVIISVADKGIGMTAIQIENLMADHTIISSANVDPKRGHGLGYLIIKDLVKMMGATFYIESIVGKGTTVHIRLKQE